MAQTPWPGPGVGLVHRQTGAPKVPDGNAQGGVLDRVMGHEWRIDHRFRNRKGQKQMSPVGCGGRRHLGMTVEPRKVGTADRVSYSARGGLQFPCLGARAQNFSPDNLLCYSRGEIRNNTVVPETVFIQCHFSHSPYSIHFTRTTREMKSKPPTKQTRARTIESSAASGDVATPIRFPERLQSARAPNMSSADVDSRSSSARRELRSRSSRRKMQISKVPTSNHLVDPIELLGDHTFTSSLKPLGWKTKFSPRGGSNERRWG